MILTFCIIICFHAILQTKQFSPKTSLRLVSYEGFLDFNPNQGSWGSTKTLSYHFFLKNLKIAPYCLDFYEHGKL